MTLLEGEWFNIICNMKTGKVKQHRNKLIHGSILVNLNLCTLVV